MGSGSSKKSRKSSASNPGQVKSQAKEPTDMAYFRKQSGEAKKRLQHQQYLARENPLPTFDISKCELSEVPSGVYSLCKVLQKEVLIVHTNWLSSLKGGGSLSDLTGLRILDLHDNEITHLPEEIGSITTLQVLNCENNRLKELPDSISQLNALQTLNVKGNKLKSLPATLCDLPALRTLDLSQNSVTSLPQNLWQVRTLDTLILDGEAMEFPESDTCLEGTESIMRYLCRVSNVDYIHPSEVLLDVLDSPKSPTDATKSNTQSMQDPLNSITETVMKYEYLKAQKQKERLELERQLEEEQRRQAQLALCVNNNKQHLLTLIVQDREHWQGELEAVQVQHDKQRRHLLDTLRQAEENASRLVSQLLEMNEKAQKTEELLDSLEKERMEAEQWFIVRQEETHNLRKVEVLSAMEKALERNNSMKQMLDELNSQRYSNLSKARKSIAEVEDQVGMVLAVRQRDQEALIQQLLNEELLQMDAFEVLQQQKDARHRRITSQIELIEQELAQLTMLEVEQRQQKVSTQRNILEEKRRTLTQLLIQLLEQRDSRVAQLKKRMNEMEEQREAGQSDYWLVQYQRLMDRKPQSLIDQESQLEVTVVKILAQAGSSAYVPLFARHRITIETLEQMTDDDLKQMGIHEFGLRKAILSGRDEYKQKRQEKKASADKLKPSCPDQAQDVSGEEVAASAPPSGPTAPAEVIARGINSECVVCLDQVSSVLFLNCGHVCCCRPCAEPIKECPLCRADISQRIQLLTDIPSMDF